MAAPIDRRRLEQTIVAWIKSATNAEAVAQSQGNVQLTHPYATFRAIAVRTIGSPDEELRLDPNAGVGVGQEILLETASHKAITFSVQLYTKVPEDAAQQADALMDAARAALSSQAQLLAFDAAGIAVIDAGDVQSLDQLEGDGFIQRAQLDVTFCVVSSGKEYVGYIDEVVITGI